MYGTYRDCIGIIQGLDKDYIGDILGKYKDNGNESGNYYSIGFRV